MSEIENSDLSGDERIEGEEPLHDKPDAKLVRLIKTVSVHPRKGEQVDERIVNVQYYNAFNFSLLSPEQQHSRLTIGITSPNPAEGKTLVASNLAVSLALGLQRKTVLVDFNFASPRLHKIFDVADRPGLTEAFSNGQIHVSQTAVEHLSVLSTGSPQEFQARILQPQDSDNGFAGFPAKFTLGLDKLAAFRDVIYSLEQEFDFVIVDMPSIKAQGVPVLFANQLNGIIVVIDSTTTKRKDVDSMLRQLDVRQVMGFVLNRFHE